MARDGVVFRWLGDVHPTRQTPDRAIVLQAVWSCALVALGSYNELFIRVIYTEWIFFGLMAVGLFVLRRRTDLERTYSAWGYPIVPFLFAVAAFAIAVNRIVSSWAKSKPETILGLALVLAGLPVYYLWTRHQRDRDNTHEDHRLS
jgi:APA family basic amino acid/polyamine antiporter